MNETMVRKRRISKMLDLRVISILLEERSPAQSMLKVAGSKTLKNREEVKPMNNVYFGIQPEKRVYQAQVPNLRMIYWAKDSL
jgi:hypothetical protein